MKKKTPKPEQKTDTALEAKKKKLLTTFYENIVHYSSMSRDVVMRYSDQIIDMVDKFVKDATGLLDKSYIDRALKLKTVAVKLFEERKRRKKDYERIQLEEEKKKEENRQKGLKQRRDDIKSIMNDKEITYREAVQYLKKQKSVKNQ